MADWRSQQIGLGIERCPTDPESPVDYWPAVDSLAKDVGWQLKYEPQQRWYQQPAPNGFALPEPTRTSPMIGELGNKINDHTTTNAVLRWIKRQH